MSMYVQNTMVHQNVVVTVAFWLDNTMSRHIATTTWLVSILFF